MNHARIRTSEYTKRLHTDSHTALHGAAQGDLHLYSPRQMHAKFTTDICAVVQPNLPAFMQHNTTQHLHGVIQGDARL